MGLALVTFSLLVEKYWDEVKSTKPTDNYFVQDW